MTSDTLEPYAAPTDPVGAALRFLSVAFAVFGGLLLSAGAVMTVVSVTGRYLFSTPIPGDIELVELGAGAAIAAFLPYCQITGSNVIVDFFTGAMAPRARARLDAVHGLVFAFCAGLVAWRMTLGGMDAYLNNDETMVLGAPIWISFVVMVPAFGLLCLVCLHGSAVRVIHGAPPPEAAS
ncbi:TRAP transporter small permease [Thalassobaculum sp.]|uniref:TRAP transporter small permease n=1 Tax=Thalassobaculum sp. TaxID=2022740 RepID=UPI0032EB9BCE